MNLFHESVFYRELVTSDNITDGERMFTECKMLLINGSAN